MSVMKQNMIRRCYAMRTVCVWSVQEEKLEQEKRRLEEEQRLEEERKRREFLALSDREKVLSRC